ncbi:hypothetical protein SAV14893_004540 [Streptomyces avermitilis]|nr:hypothetical protein SAVMC3_16440 [Streptomyces avermitilis]GDY61061.1 hypothetical protein SAV14893_004540 [Streptomyces avermitilis]GDY87681.1 hypothetical protein SAVCW2_68800 [Streptomyces avermitilis]
MEWNSANRFTSVGNKGRDAAQRQEKRMSSRRPPRRDPRSHAHGPARRWWRRHWKAGTAVLSALFVATASPLIYDAIKSGTSAIVEGDRPPFAWTTQVDSPEDAGCKSYVFDSDAKMSAPSPNEDWQVWATRQGGTAANLTTIRLTLQGRSASSVVLHGLRVDVESKSRPKGSVYDLGLSCGGLTSRNFDINLDDPEVAPASRAGDDGTPAARFPYRISSTEPEVFLVHARTENCDCRFHLNLDWTSGDRKGTLRIGDGKNAFRVIGTQRLRWFELDMDKQQWVKQPVVDTVPGAELGRLVKRSDVRREAA